jgi:hypothetical protein
MIPPSADYLQGAADERAKMRREIDHLLPQAYSMESLANVVNLLLDWLTEQGENSERPK